MRKNSPRKSILTLMITITLALWPLGSLSWASTPISWDTLKALDPSTGQMSESLKKLDQTPVEIAGFIVPLELGEYIDMIEEFLLVPDPLACIHVPPPPPNQMIYVKMKTPIAIDMDFRGVSINGILSIPRPQADYGYASFELIGHSATEAEIDFDDPLEDLIMEDPDNVDWQAEEWDLDPVHHP